MDIRTNEEGHILCNKYVFRNENGDSITLFGKPLESNDPDFVCFLAGSGRRYEIRRVLILEICETNKLFQIKESRHNFVKRNDEARKHTNTDPFAGGAGNAAGLPNNKRGDF